MESSSESTTKAGDWYFCLPHGFFLTLRAKCDIGNLVSITDGLVTNVGGLVSMKASINSPTSSIVSGGKYGSEVGRAVSAKTSKSSSRSPVVRGKESGNSKEGIIGSFASFVGFEPSAELLLVSVWLSSSSCSSSELNTKAGVLNFRRGFLTLFFEADFARDTRLMFV